MLRPFAGADARKHPGVEVPRGVGRRRIDILQRGGEFGLRDSDSGAMAGGPDARGSSGRGGDRADQSDGERQRQYRRLELDGVTRRNVLHHSGWLFVRRVEPG